MNDPESYLSLSLTFYYEESYDTLRPRKEGDKIQRPAKSRLTLQRVRCLFLPFLDTIDVFPVLCRFCPAQNVLDTIDPDMFTIYDRRPRADSLTTRETDSDDDGASLYRCIVDSALYKQLIHFIAVLCCAKVAYR